MKKSKISLLMVLVLCLTCFIPNSNVKAATRYECENMTKGGQYAGNTWSPFQGVALYANNDYCQVGGVTLRNTSTTFSLRGCSNNNSTASVVLKLNGWTMGTFNFTGTTPTVKTVTCTPNADTYTVQLIVTSDNGTWDAYVDYLEISQGSSSGNAGGNNGGNTGGQNGNVYLCFDDGPTSMSSTFVSNLKNAGCTKATFFVWGNRVASNGSGWNALCNSGFSLQNHSYSHSHMTSWSYQQVYNDLQQCNQVITNAGKAKPTRIRLPYLESNSTIQSVCSSLGLTIVQPNVDTQDWNGADTNSIVNRASSLNNGQNVLMHDGNYNTCNAISSIVSRLKSRGLGFAQY